MGAKEWDEEVERQNLIDAYEAFYVTGFRSNNVTLIDQIVQYPLTYIKDGKTRVVGCFPIDPARLKSDLGWDHSKDWSFEALAIGKEQAHVTAKATRCRADGSVIERVHGIYIFAKVAGAWKMSMLADAVI